MDKVTVQLSVTFRRVRGEEVDTDYLLDYFAGAIGEQNAAKPPMTLTIDESEYVVELVDA